MHYKISKVDPIKINNAKFYARALFVAYCYASKNLGKNKKLSMIEIYSYLEGKFTENSLFCFLIKNADPTLLDFFDAETIITSDLPLGTLYESLLSIETFGKEIRKGKEFKNKLGSYYTPIEYAEEITKLTLDEFFLHNNKRDILSAKVADFSCGGGAFLITLLSLLKRRGFSNEEMRMVSKNIYAFDVDPIALEIAKISVLDFVGLPDDYETINNNFIHGNFLLHTKHEKSSMERLSASMKGFIYHEDLAINEDCLQKYDVILGNPPWEKIRLEEKKFYAQYSENIDYINFRFDLDVSVEEALKNDFIRNFAFDYEYQLETAKRKIKENEFFADSTHGELNTCSLFADACYRLLSPRGSAGIFVKSALVTSKANSVLFEKLKNRVISIYDFINSNKIFEIDSRERFSIVILGDRQNKNTVLLGMNLTNIADIDKQSREVALSLFEQFNPETKMVPNISSARDLQILSNIYNSFSVFSKAFGSVKFGRLVHLTNHIQDIQKVYSPFNIPIFEGKFFSLFDNAFSGFNDVPFEERYKSKASTKRISEIDKKKGVKPLCRFFISKEKWGKLSRGYCSDYMLAWHSLTSATNVRSCVATLLPFIPASQSVQFLVCRDNKQLVYLTGIFNSVLFDYIVKCKLNGIDLTQSVINQIPVPSESTASSLFVRYNGKRSSVYEFIINIVGCLYKHDVWLKDLFKEFISEDFFLDRLERKELFMLLDVMAAVLYQINYIDLEYVLERFDSFYDLEERGQIKKLYLTITK